MSYGRGSRAAIDTQSRFRKRSALNAEMVSSQKRVKDSPHGKEFDTYKVGTTANSTSTMHKLTSKPITLECFEIDDYNDSTPFLHNDEVHVGNFVDDLITDLEELRQMYLATNDKRYWKELVRWLPSGWLQTRTVTMNYENLLSVCHQREHHKLTEWSGDDPFGTPSFIKFAKSLPYANDFIFPST